MNQRWKSILQNYEWPIVWSFAAFALFLGIIGFTQYFFQSGERKTQWDVFYLAVQLFTMESGAVAGRVPALLQIARFLAPAVTAYTASKALMVVFRDQLQQLKLKTIRNHVIIAGLGRTGMLFARAFRENGSPVVVLERDGGNEELEISRDNGTFALVGDARSKQLLEKAKLDRARILIAVAGADGVNAEIAVQAREMLPENGEPLTCLIHIVDSELCQLLRKQELMIKKKNSMRLEFFNLYEAAARDLFENHPLRLDASNPPNLTIIGFGRMGENILLTAARDWSRRKPSPERFRITVIDRGAASKILSLEERFPYIQNNCRLSGLDIEIDSREFHRKEFLKSVPTAAYVCMDNDSIVLSTGLLLRQWLPADIPIFLRMSREKGLAKLLYQPADTLKNLIPFGSVERMCTPALISGGIRETLARVIHEEYVRRAAKDGESVPVNPALKSWKDLPDSLKNSNRSQSDHIGEKLSAVRCDIVLFAEENAENFQFTETEIELLARMEHDRWIQEREREGWTFAPGAKDLEEKTSPYLVPYDELSEEIKDYDRNTVRELPHFLARAGYQIYRL